MGRGHDHLREARQVDGERQLALVAHRLEEVGDGGAALQERRQEER